MCCKWCSFAFIAYYLYIQSTQNIPPTNCFTLSLLATICDKVCNKYQEKTIVTQGLIKCWVGSLRLFWFFCLQCPNIIFDNSYITFCNKTASLLNFEMICYATNAPLQLVQAYTSLFSLAFLELVKEVGFVNQFPSLCSSRIRCGCIATMYQYKVCEIRSRIQTNPIVFFDENPMNQG